MSKYTQISDDLYNYMCEVSLDENEVLKEIREYTKDLEYARMQISPLQGQFMSFLIKSISAKKILEVGTFTGYSSTIMALSIPKDGKLITCDLNKDWTNIAIEFWKKANVHNKIELKLGLAQNSIDGLIEDGEGGSFDFIFLDADKENYPTYYEKSIELLRVGGIICIDNVLWSGRVIDDSNNEKTTMAIRELNKTILNDKRVDKSLINLADGLYLVRKIK